MTLRVHLDAYCTAFNDRALDRALSLFSDHALFEMPLLGQRLLGTAEIAAGFQRMFEVTESAEIVLLGAQEAGDLIIAEGAMTAKLRRDNAPVRMPLAITLAVKDRHITRLSTYLDARPYRLWADGPIFANSTSHN